MHTRTSSLKRVERGFSARFLDLGGVIDFAQFRQHQIDGQRPSKVDEANAP